jgi:hypothetical protein
MAGLAMVWLSTCGGIAVVDGDDTAGQGGSGATTTTSMQTNVVTIGPGPVSSVTTGPPTAECQSACGTVYDCGLQAGPNGQLCPGFTGDFDQKQVFVGDCASGVLGLPGGCENVISIAQQGDCLAAITYFESHSPEFVYDCNNGPG